MKAQCVHSDTGICETCFKYEAKIQQLEKEVEKLKSDNSRLSRERSHKQREEISAMANQVYELEKELASVNKMLLSINQHVVPGVTDSIDGLKKIFEELAVTRKQLLDLSMDAAFPHDIDFVDEDGTERTLTWITGDGPEYNSPSYWGVEEAHPKIEALKKELQSLKSYSTGEVEEVAKALLLNLGLDGAGDDDPKVHKDDLKIIVNLLSSIHQKYRGGLGDIKSTVENWIVREYDDVLRIQMKDFVIEISKLIGGK